MVFKKPDSFDGLDLDALQKLADEAMAEGRALLGNEDADLSDEQIAEAEQVMADHAEIVAEIETRNVADAERAARIAALRGQTTEAEVPAEEEPEAEVEEPEAEVVEEPAAEVEEKEKELVTASAKGGAVRAAASKAPEVIIVPEAKPAVGTLIAAANVPGFDTSSELPDMETLAKAFLARSRSFMGRPAPAKPEIFERYGVANIRRPENEFTIAGRMSPEDTMDVINAAVKQARLPGGSLIAAGGWCAPSNTVYDFCEQETVDGLLSLPEVTITHGGINFTKGPDLASLLGNANFGFTQTEAQAEAGTTKPCFEITCPDFTDVRLDAVGWCLRAGILTASPAGWPELVRRFLNLATIAHQYRMNSDSLNRLSAAIGAAVNYVELGSATADILDALSLQASIIRESQFLAVDATIEVILPLWAPDVIRADLARRSGDLGYLTISDAQLRSLFTARGLAPQFVRGYQTIGASDGTAYPTTLEAMLYPAGSYVLGVNDVISLDTVYDSPSLTTNTYTAAFFEEARLLFNPCGTGRKVSISLTGNSAILGIVGASKLGETVTP